MLKKVSIAKDPRFRIIKWLQLDSKHGSILRQFSERILGAEQSSKHLHRVVTIGRSRHYLYGSRLYCSPVTFSSDPN